MTVQLTTLPKQKIAAINLPAEVDRALAACKEGEHWLAACETIDEAKYWSDKADAYEAWAKIRKSLTIDVAARRLKLKAHRRMGALAAELRPRRSAGYRKGRMPGPRELLMKTGLGQLEASNALSLARADESRFDLLVALPRPPSPCVAARSLSNKHPDWTCFSNRASGLRAFCRAHSAAEFARSLAPDEVELSRRYAQEIIDWLDELDRHLQISGKRS